MGFFSSNTQKKLSLLPSEQFDKLPFKTDDAVGAALPSMGKGFVRLTGNPLYDLDTVRHELQELDSPGGGIRYKKWYEYLPGGKEARKAIAPVYDPIKESIIEPVASGLQSVIDPVKDVIGEGGIGALLGGLASVGLAPFTGGATLSMLPYMMAGGGMYGGAMEEENQLMNALMGGLGGYGVGSLGAGLAGVNVAPMFGEGASLAKFLGGSGGAAGAGGGAGMTPAGTYGQPFDFMGQQMIPGKMGGGFDPNILSQMGLSPNIMGQGVETLLSGGGSENPLQKLWKQLTGGGQQEQQNPMQQLLSSLFGGRAGTTGAGGGQAGGISPSSAYTPMPQNLMSLMGQYRGLPEYQQRADIFGKGQAGLEQLGNIGPEFFQQFQQTPSEAFTPYMDLMQRKAQHMASLTGIPESGLAQFAQGMTPAMLSMEQQLRNQQMQQAQQALTARSFASGQQAGFDPMQMAMQFAQQDIPQRNLADQSQMWNEQLRNAQSQAKVGGISSILGSGAESMFGIPGLSNVINQFSPLWGGGTNTGAGNIFGGQQTGQTQSVNNLNNVFKQLGIGKLYD